MLFVILVLTHFLCLPVFICSYMFLAPLFGYLGDRYNRKFIMLIGISFWSVVTLASSYTPKEVSVSLFHFTLVKTKYFTTQFTKG